MTDFTAVYTALDRAAEADARERAAAAADLAAMQRQRDSLAALLADPGALEGRTVRVGDLKVTKAGERLANLDIWGQLEIAAPGVTVEPSVTVRGPKATTSNLACIKITDPAARDFSCAATIAPAWPSVRLDGVRCSRPGRLHHMNVSGVVDGFVVFGDDVTVERCWVHDLPGYASDPNQGGAPSHNDAVMVQSGARVKLLSNIMEGASNAAVMVTADAGAVSYLQIRGGLVTGPNAGINIGRKVTSPTGFTIEGVRFGRDLKHPILHSLAGFTARGCWDDTGAPITKP